MPGVFSNSGGSYDDRGGHNTDKRYWEEVEFYRPDGSTERKCIGWCLEQGFHEIDNGLWSGDWYYEHFPNFKKEQKEKRLKCLRFEIWEELYGSCDDHPPASGDRRRQLLEELDRLDHALDPNSKSLLFCCPVGGCNTNFPSQEEVNMHVRTSRGKGHRRYRELNGIPSESGTDVTTNREKQCPETVPERGETRLRANAKPFQPSTKAPAMKERKPERLPVAGRNEEGFTSKTPILSIGKKKLHDEPGLARLLYKSFVLNGVSYCRRHFMICCHLCEVDGTLLYDEVMEERRELGLEPAGDEAINKWALKWKEYILDKQLQITLKHDLCRMRYSGDKATFQLEWAKLREECSIEEHEINRRFLAEVQETLNVGASQCCYYACDTPKKAADNKLLRCTGCGIAKYCCKEHQKMDWVWEHKGECTCQLPQFIKDEIEQDRIRNLNGNYDFIEDWDRESLSSRH